MDLFDPTNAEFSALEDDLALPPAPVSPPSPNRWPPQLIFDLALGLDGYEEIEARYNLAPTQLERLFTLPGFRQEVAVLTRELRSNNTIFTHKAKIQAETYLDTMNDLMNDPTTPASTKLSIFQTLTKLGNLEPKEAKSDALQAGQGQQAMRMVVEWVGGPQDHSPLAKQVPVIPLHAVNS